MISTGAVSPQYLLEGAAYALQQAGYLLRDADVLYRNGSYASAVAMTAFGREEIGKHKLLLDLRRQVMAGKSFSVREVGNYCGQHVVRQKAGTLGITLSGDENKEMDDLYQKLRTLDRGSSEWKATTEEINKAWAERWDNLPKERHERRKKALYVDSVSPTEWSKPVERETKDSAQRELIDALNDYMGCYDRYTRPEPYREDDPEFYEALEKWTDKPAVPELPRPPLPRA